MGLGSHSAPLHQRLTKYLSIALNITSYRKETVMANPYGRSAFTSALFYKDPMAALAWLEKALRL